MQVSDAYVCPRPAGASRGHNPAARHGAGVHGPDHRTGRRPTQDDGRIGPIPPCVAELWDIPNSDCGRRFGTVTDGPPCGRRSGRSTVGARVSVWADNQLAGAAPSPSRAAGRQRHARPVPIACTAARQPSPRVGLGGGPGPEVAARQAEEASGQATPRTLSPARAVQTAQDPFDPAVTQPVHEQLTDKGLFW